MNRLFNEERLQSRLSSIGTGYKLIYKQEIGSTNDLALSDYAEGHAAVPSVYLCDMQTKGKGRLGRVWESAEGSSLTFSTLVKPDCAVESFPMLTEVFGLAACMAIRSLCGCDVLIKWPNDIVIDGRKICGILTEVTCDMKCVVIGSGFNMLKSAFTEDVAVKAISLEEACGVRTDPGELLCAVLKQFHEMYEKFLYYGNMKGLKETYETYLINKNMRTGIKGKDGEIKGTALGIDDFGALIFRKEDGEIITVTSGEVSVSGVYGCK